MKIQKYAAVFACLLFGIYCSGAEELPEKLMIELPGGAELEMIRVKADTFIMGKKGRRDVSAHSTDIFSQEHKVTLKNDFYLGKFEVTAKQYSAVMGSPLRGDENLPCANVSWYNAMIFCDKLNKSGKAPEGFKFSLPTETQWEFAARGGHKSRNYTFSGSNDPEEVMFVDRGIPTGSNTRTFRPLLQPVGKKGKNELGFYDMSGNAAEWCLDDFIFDGRKVVPEFSREAGDDSQKERSIRGGMVALLTSRSRPVFRGVRRRPNATYPFIGFRAALIPANTESLADAAIRLDEEAAAAAEEEKKTKKTGKPAARVKKIVDMTIDLGEGSQLELVKIPAGSFSMGEAAKNKKYRHPGVRGQREVIKESFYMGIYEVTQAQWKAVMGTDIEKISGSGPLCGVGDDFPMYHLTWADAMGFCDQLNKSGKAPEGFKFSLPTDLQWEYAARGSSKGKAYSYAGSDDAESVGWFAADSDVSVHPVGGKKPNRLGLFDMSGNVAEICLDYYFSRGNGRDARKGRNKNNDDDGGGEDNDGEDNAGRRVEYYAVRGGSWDEKAEYAALHDKRSFLLPSTKYNTFDRVSYSLFYNVGFRVVLIPDTAENSEK